MRSESLEFLAALANAPSPSGYEQPAARLYRDYAGRFADEVSTDVSGNVSAVLNPAARMKVMLAGHLDEIGFIVHYINDEGLLFFAAIGGHDSIVPVGQRVWVHGRERLPGVIGRKAIHLLDQDELKAKPAMSDLWIDIGASSRSEAAAAIDLGSVVTYQYEFQPLMGERAAARGFDNKAGLLVVAETLRLLREEGGLHPDVGVHAVATVQEEIGSRGAKTAAYRMAPQSGLAVDVGHALDYPGIVKTKHGELAVGKGPGISHGANTNPVVLDLLKQGAREEDIPYQVSVSPGVTPTDANALQVNQGGVATGLLEVPLRYMHTPCEVLSLKDVENTARLMAAYCRRITPGTDFRPL